MGRRGRGGRGQRGLDDHRGQAMVELAFVLPILLLLVVGIGDFARIYTTSLTIESAVREGADYGAFYSSNWDTSGSPSNSDKTMAEIQHRVCVAASTLPDYLSTDPSNETCTNPNVTITLENPNSIDCTTTVPAGDKPCAVDVTAEYNFRMFLGSVGIPGLFQFPATYPITRSDYFVVNDFPTS